MVLGASDEQDLGLGSILWVYVYIYRVLYIVFSHCRTHAFMTAICVFSRLSLMSTSIFIMKNEHKYEQENDKGCDVCVVKILREVVAFRCCGQVGSTRGCGI